MCSRNNQNTVQPQAVNLVDTEPCPNPGTAFFIAGPVARNPPLWRTRLQTKRPSHPAPAAKEARLRTGQEMMNDIEFQGTALAPNPTKRSKPKPAVARLYARTAPGPRARCPCSEGAHSLSEDAHRFRKVRILENPEDSFEDVASVFKDAQFLVSLFAAKGADREKRMTKSILQGTALDRPHKKIEAEVGGCATLTRNATGSRAMPW